MYGCRVPVQQPHAPPWESSAVSLCPLAFRRDNPETFFEFAGLYVYWEKGILPAPGGPSEQTQAYGDGILAFAAGTEAGRRKRQEIDAKKAQPRARGRAGGRGRT